jgi:hypothetical protein
MVMEAETADAAVVTCAVEVVVGSEDAVVVVALLDMGDVDTVTIL